MRDLLMWLALTRKFRARWTEKIQDEWARNLLANRPDLGKEQVSRTIAKMNEAVPDCLVTCESRIFMQPSEDRRGEGRGRPGIQQRCWAPLLVRDDRQAHRYSRIGVFATDGSNRDTTT